MHECNKYLIMKQIIRIFLVIILIVFSSCAQRPCPSTKGIRMGSAEIINGLYREANLLYDGGAIGGSVRSVYLTDSSSFRKFIGKVYDNEEYDILFSEGLIYAIKVDIHSYHVLECKAFVLSQLEAVGKWE